ncbi:hypothetical protein LI058_14425 [Clostridium perfringens]|uniref:hypothetical protein n=2 Tax=Clostridium perfringens TaxID=1502 RepID=UPI000D711162|nr:hypothetical protein [Clostridium perfringens]MBO3338520.1 hypothetical protein [Clostridium perfringens]MBO3339700.1 hypothetical protein [Clostridium perfringens]MCX0374661.1 hypothetical protein [Clostridium perfringens]MDM0635721.1 hypothetical protein [Clostridium perfringens]NGT31830.1 hypothetical protein [Clostridium perfringens]
MDKKKLIIGGSILVILIIGGTIFSLNKLKNNKQEPIKVEENKKDNKIVEKSNEENKGLSDEELKKKYYLLQNSNISVKDRVEASEVARKFAKDMTEFDINNPKKNEEEALSLVSTDIDKEVEGYFITLGQSNDIKEKKIKSIRSEEGSNWGKNYVEIHVYLEYEIINNNDNKKLETIGYYIKLEKIDGKYKVTSYKY